MLRKADLLRDLDINEAAFQAMLHRLSGTRPPEVMTSGELQLAMSNFQQAAFWVREHLKAAAARGMFDD